VALWERGLVDGFSLDALVELDSLESAGCSACRAREQLAS
jgi:hypothetical protein